MVHFLKMIPKLSLNCVLFSGLFILTVNCVSVFKFNQYKFAEQSEYFQTGKAKDSSQCGYETCNQGKDGMLNVHMVPHTHDDVGWLKTVDQYFYGANNSIQPAEVQYILDNVISELQKDANRRFIYVEMAFFDRWWNEQDDATRHIVKGLVNEGRLEFILGGWCMNDEASTHYTAIIDQHTKGFKLLQDNFGECGRPKIGWQIDPFGHSREQASLFAQFGMDGLFFGRLDYQDKDRRLLDKEMEMMWMGSANLGDQGALFTGVNFNGYGPPTGFCYDDRCSDQPIMDDPRLHDYNVDERVKSFLKAVNDQAKNYSTNHIMLTMGGDFQFSNARQNFKNLDKLIKYVNQMQENGSNVNAFYSTPSCYAYALNKVGQTYKTKTDDFFPYANRGHSFWTGYFTSRAAFKAYVRFSNAIFQACKQLDTLAQLGAESGSSLKIDNLRMALGVAQHHDAVSGTEKQHVAYDYAERIAKGVSECEDVINYAYGKLMQKTSQKLPTQYLCTHRNVSMCDVSENNKQFTVVVYNPSSQPRNVQISVPVVESQYTVVNVMDNGIASQVLPVSDVTKSLPERNGSKAMGDLVFTANLPALGFSTYQISSASSKEQVQNEIFVPKSGQMFNITNGLITLTFDGTSGLLSSFFNHESKLNVPIKQEYLWYKGFQGNNSKDVFQSSGAYIFRSDGNTAYPMNNMTNVTVIKGDLVQEVRQVFSNYTSQVIRLRQNERHAEFEFTVGPIPVGDKVGREVISRFTTDLRSNKTFYTDANGREVLKRVRDYRETWKLNQTEPVSGNYYPVNSRIYIRDEMGRDVQLTVLTDRSQGGASIVDGQLEIMVHRRTLHDDSLGVGEPLSEPGIDGKGLRVRGTHYVMVDTVARSQRIHRQSAQHIFDRPLVTFSVPGNQPLPNSYNKSFVTEWSGLKKALPDNVNLLTLEQFSANDVLLRFEHIYEIGEDPDLSKPVSFSLKDLFVPITVKSAIELTLGANQNLNDAQRLQWKTANHVTDGKMSDFVTPVDPSTLMITLKPMQIRTFRIQLA